MRAAVWAARAVAGALAAGVLMPVAAAAGACGEADVPLAAIARGDGRLAGPGSSVEVQATVSAAFTGDAALDGFYLAETGDDGEPAGLFVYAPELDPDTARKLRPGTVVRLNGRTGRYRGQRQIERVAEVTVCGRGPAPEPVALALPASAERLRALSGLPVRLKQPLTVVDNHQLARYGSLTLSARGRVFAGEPPLQRGERLILDDGRHAIAPEQVPYLDADGTRRIGSQVEALTGVLAPTFHAYRLHPTRVVAWTDANPRRSLSPPAGGAVRAAVFNIQNYFARLGLRGAESAGERRLQQAKLAVAVRAIDADVLAVLEVGNSARAVESLIRSVNAGVPEPKRYRASLGTAPVGDDAIRSVLLYRPARVHRLGEARQYASPVFERPLVMARFGGTDQRPFSVVVGHFKSKGGCPSGQQTTDPVTGCWGERRAAQAKALLEAIGAEADAAARWLVLADLNAYAHEIPLTLLREAGLVNLARRLPPPQRYTYVYRGHSGTLDYALASGGLAEEVADVQIWHANADEPPFLGYRGRDPEAAERAGAFRSSDHDPVLVDLEVSR